MDPEKDYFVACHKGIFVLTKHTYKAMLLQQLLFWSSRCKDYDAMLEEERSRSGSDPTPFLSHGWVYKSAEDLGNEALISASKRTISRFLDELVQSGWVHRRQNPNNNWDHKPQYRVDLRKLQTDLHAIGHTLPGYRLPKDDFSTRHGDASMSQGVVSMSQDGVTIQKNPEKNQGIQDSDSDSNLEGTAPVSVSRRLIRNLGKFSGDLDEMTFEVFKTIHDIAPEVKQHAFSELFGMLIQEQAVWEQAHHVRQRQPEEAYVFHLKRFVDKYRSRKLLMNDLAYAEICRFCGIPCTRDLDKRARCDQDAVTLGTVVSKVQQGGATLGDYCMWVKEKCLERGWALTPEVITRMDLVNDFLSETCSSEV